jgi:hypothetical protein
LFNRSVRPAILIYIFRHYSIDLHIFSLLCIYLTWCLYIIYSLFYTFFPHDLFANIIYSMRFVTYVAEEKFMKSMVKLVSRAEKKGGRDNLEASDKVLELIESWGTTFANHPQKDQVRLFISYYHELKIKGVRFPHPSTTQTTSVLTPSKRPSRQQQQQHQHQSGSGSKVGSSPSVSAPLQSVNGLPEEYAIVSSTIELISQALDHVTSPQELENNDIVTDLMAQITSVHGKIMSDLEAALLSNSSTLTGLLALNDNIHSVIRRREGILTGQIQFQSVAQSSGGGSGGSGGGGSGGGSSGGSSRDGSSVGGGGGSGGGSGSGGGRGNDGETASDISDLLGSDINDGNTKSVSAPSTNSTGHPLVPKLSGPTSGGGRSHGRSSPSLKPKEATGTVDDLLGLSFKEENPEDSAPKPPLRQQSAGFSSLMREDSGWSEFSEDDTTKPLEAAKSPLAPGTTASSGLDDLSQLYQNNNTGNTIYQDATKPLEAEKLPLTPLTTTSSGLGDLSQLYQKNVTGNNVMGNNVMGNNVMGNNVMGNNVMGNNVMGNNVMGNNAMGNNAMGNNVMGNNSQQWNTMNRGVTNNDMHNGMHNVMHNGMNSGMNSGISTKTETLQERPRSGSNPFDQFNPFTDMPKAEDKQTKTESNSNNPFDF